MHQDWLLEGGWRGGSEALTPQPAGAGRCTKSSYPKRHGCRGFFPPLWCPLQQSSGWSSQYLSSGVTFPWPTAVFWGHYGQEWVVCQGKEHPMLLLRNSSLVTCIQQAWLEPWPWGRLSPRKPAGVIRHPAGFPPGTTGRAAWTEQGRGLILLSLLDFNWKGICLWLNFLPCLSWSLVDQKKCKLKENILDVPDFKVEHE